MTRFSSLAGLAGFIAGTIVEMEHEKHAALEAGADILLKEAKSLPGTYQAGWPALQAETIARKTTGDSPLLETGALRDSYEKTVLKDTAEVGSNADTALWHELGTSRMPPRPVLAVTVTNKGEEAAHVAGGLMVAKLVKD